MDWRDYRRGTVGKPIVGIHGRGEVPQHIHIGQVDVALPKGKVRVEVRMRDEGRQREEVKPVPVPDVVREQVGDGREVRDTPVADVMEEAGDGVKVLLDHRKDIRLHRLEDADVLGDCLDKLDDVLLELRHLLHEVDDVVAILNRPPRVVQLAVRAQLDMVEKLLDVLEGVLLLLHQPVVGVGDRFLKLPAVLQGIMVVGLYLAVPEGLPVSDCLLGVYWPSFCGL